MKTDAPVALVTGGAKRIGRAIATELHNAGFDIALHYRRSARDAESLAAELCRRRPASCTTLVADLATPEGVAKAAEAVLARHTSLDLLVNNASGFSPTPVESAAVDQVDEMLGSNFRGPFLLIQALLGALRAAEGNIVNIIDMEVERPLKGFSAYTAAKAAMASLTRSLAVELGPDIRVNGVAPGAILWPEDDAAYDEAARDSIIEKTPLGRLGDPVDIARTVRFLACEANFITGQVIAVDGGRSLT